MGGYSRSHNRYRSGLLGGSGRFISQSRGISSRFRSRYKGRRFLARYGPQEFSRGVVACERAAGLGYDFGRAGNDLIVDAIHEMSDTDRRIRTE